MQTATFVHNWGRVLKTATCEDPDPISRWLIITRAAVFPMTIVSAVTGGLLAAGEGEFAWGPFLLAVAGLLLAHAGNNMVNDYFDVRQGVDTEDYYRAQYAQHPVLGGLISIKGLLRAAVLTNIAGLGIAVWLFTVRGWPVLAFTAAGLFISIFYVAPPLKLKRRGLGEPGVVAVWGPLMIAGTYFVTAGQLPGWVWLASIPYSLLVAAVLFGKHLDKYEADSQKGIGTLVVRLGERRARRVTRLLITSFFLSVIVMAVLLTPWVLITFLTLPGAVKILRVFSRPMPENPPPGYPVWPLWYAAHAFVLARRAGLGLVLGLAMNLLLPVKI